MFLSKDDKRSLRYLVTTTTSSTGTTTTSQGEILQDFNLEFTIQYDSNSSALNGKFTLHHFVLLIRAFHIS